MLTLEALYTRREVVAAWKAVKRTAINVFASLGANRSQHTMSTRDFIPCSPSVIKVPV